jgi:hypothetical protein
MLFEVRYPSGHVTWATGYPNQILVVQQVPPGPDSCYLDELEVDFSTEPAVVLRVVGGPRRPTIRVRVPASTREAWMDAREAEDWQTAGDDRDPELVWVVADRDGLDAADLVRTGGVIAAS